MTVRQCAGRTRARPPARPHMHEKRAAVDDPSLRPITFPSFSSKPPIRPLGGPKPRRCGRLRPKSTKRCASAAEIGIRWVPSSSGSAASKKRRWQRSSSESELHEAGSDRVSMLTPLPRCRLFWSCACHHRARSPCPHVLCTLADVSDDLCRFPRANFRSPEVVLRVALSSGGSGAKSSIGGKPAGLPRPGGIGGRNPPPWKDRRCVWLPILVVIWCCPPPPSLCQT